MKHPCKTFIFLAFGAFLYCSAGRAEGSIGIWLRDDSSARMRLAPCGIALCGTLIWLREPRNDIYNPDQKERDQPLVGRRILSGMAQEGQTGPWKGSIYNPDDGRTYIGTMSIDGSRLNVQGCVTGGVICSSMAWTKVN